jgi:hypothetical protein
MPIRVRNAEADIFGWLNQYGHLPGVQRFVVFLSDDAFEEQRGRDQLCLLAQSAHVHCFLEIHFTFFLPQDLSATLPSRPY